MTEQEKQEQQIIEKLQAQKNSVRPSRELLSKIIAQLPASPADKPAQEELQPFPVFEKQHTSFTWIRFAIPVGAMLLVGGIFFVSQLSSNPATPVATTKISTIPAQQQLSATQSVAPIPPEQSLSLASITQEEQQIDEQLTFESFFADEKQMQEIDMALAEF